MNTYVLQVSSTGKLLKQEESSLSLAIWQKKIERKLLRYKRTPEDIKQAILNGDTIGGWDNYDTFSRSNSGEVVQTEINKVFRGYEKFYESKLNLE